MKSIEEKMKNLLGTAIGRKNIEFGAPKELEEKVKKL